MLKKNISDEQIKILSLFGAIPALLIGVYTMNYFDVPRSIWLSNFIFVFLGITIGFISNRFLHFFASINPKLIVIISVMLLILPFFAKGIMNVHRWISISNLHLNIGLIVCPIILIQFSKIGSQFLSYLIFVLVTTIFLLQPDASQVAAFSISISLLLINKMRNKTSTFFILLFSLVSIMISWYNLDNLQAVIYVERIIVMTGEINTGLMLIAILSLVWLPFPFFILFSKENKLIAMSLGIYFSISIISTFFGNFPVMILGYGISPIMGYFIALSWLLNSKNLECKH